MESETQQQYQAAGIFRRKLERPMRRPEPMEDPFSRCTHTDHPCTPGAPCALMSEEVCTSECGDYASFSEDDWREDR